MLYRRSVGYEGGQYEGLSPGENVDVAGPIVLMETGATALLNALAQPSNWLNTLRYGLFSNDWWPAVTDNVGRYTPADFPGYSGFQSATSWGTPFLEGDLAAISAAPITWIRGAGFGGGWIFGYYVVDAFGVLILACRAWGYAGTIVASPGQPISVIPILGMVSRYQ